MTLMSRLMVLFPLSVVLLFLASVYALVKYPSLATLVLPLFVLYLYPVLCFRIHNLIWPLHEGSYDVAAKKYLPWWGSHQMQLIYFACPFLEAVLRTIPGVYSAWLRLWGAEIGKNIYWTPNIEVDDRPMLVMGDHVIVGHKLHFLNHVIAPRNGVMSLLLKKITIGEGSFLGAGSRLGPGVTIEAGTKLPILTDCQINQYVRKADYIRKRQEVQDDFADAGQADKSRLAFEAMANELGQQPTQPMALDPESLDG
ncbi:MAG: acyl transferase [Candidatus Melainabacteria bacterium HGW-Melainabacteria-1]|nr:MAG: acyl transferase [Candidatus Melainabacteria bacterium HGW-Melainabacteria-1]